MDSDIFFQLGILRLHGKNGADTWYFIPSDAYGMEFNASLLETPAETRLRECSLRVVNFFLLETAEE